MSDLVTGLLIVHAIGVAFLTGYLLADKLDNGSRASWPERIEWLTVIAWPVMVPIAAFIGLRQRRRMRWWNGLTIEERQRLNDQGKGYWQ